MSNLKPWEAGYKTPADAPYDPNINAHLGGKAKQANALAGIPPKEKPPEGKRPGPVRTNTELQDALDAMTEETISLKQKVFFDAMVLEYIHDFNVSMAYIRAGGNPSSVPNLAYKAFRTKYFQDQLRMISERMDSEHIISANDIIIGLKKEANYHGEDGASSSRVKAYSVLAKIKGIEAPKKSEQTITHKGGVMIVPMAPSVDAWEGQATQLQTQLKTDVRT